MTRSENLILAAHTDGTMIVYDKDKEDADFVPEDRQKRQPSKAGQGNGVNNNVVEKLEVSKSVRSQNQRSNPVAVWKLSKQKINAFAFAPNGRHLAVASEDGYLRVLDYLEEE